MMRTLKIVAWGLAVLALSGVALHADTLSLGANYVSVNVLIGGVSHSEGGGSIGPSTLNGVSLPWVFCVDLYDTINVPGTYTATVTHDASMTGLTNDGLGLTGGVVNNAAQVAYLLETYAAAAMAGTAGAGSSADQQAALQAAIWHVIYGNVALDTANSNSARVTDYTTFTTGVGSGNIGALSWLSPGTGLQGLVTQVPDGGMTLILLGGTLAGIESLRRKFRV